MHVNKLLIVLASLAMAARGQELVPPENCTGLLTGTVCIEFQGQDFTRSWEDASNYCQGEGGHLVSIDDERIEEDLLEHLTSLSVTGSLWIGAREGLSATWYWVSDESILSPQGCHAAGDGEDLAELFDVDNLIPDTCIEVCDRNNYTYAGLMGGMECRCGDEFGLYGIGSGCTVACEGDERIDCGGFSANFVYHTKGEWGRWAANQPNNFNGFQFCASLDQENEMFFADERCESNFAYVCAIQISDCENITTPEGVTVPGDSGCYFIGTVARSWHSAREDCFRRQGDLVKLSNQEEWAELVGLIDVYTEVAPRYHWIGVSRWRLSWSDGRPVGYSSWAENSPDRFTNGCILVDVQDNSLIWRDESCTMTHPFLCQFELLQTTTATSSTAMTTTTTTMTTTSTSIATTTMTTTSTSMAATSMTTGGDPPTSTPPGRQTVTTSASGSLSVMSTSISVITGSGSESMTSGSGSEYMTASFDPDNVTLLATTWVSDAEDTDATTAPPLAVSTNGALPPGGSEGSTSDSSVWENKLFIGVIVLLCVLILVGLSLLFVFLIKKQRISKSMQIQPQNGSVRKYDVSSDTWIPQAEPAVRHVTRVCVCGLCGVQCRHLKSHLVQVHGLTKGSDDLKEALAAGKTVLINSNVLSDDVMSFPEFFASDKTCPLCGVHIASGLKSLQQHMVLRHGLYPHEADSVLKEYRPPRGSTFKQVSSTTS